MMVDKYLKIFTFIIFAWAATACSPDKVPPGGWKKLERQKNSDSDMLKSQEPLRVEEEFRANLSRLRPQKRGEFVLVENLEVSHTCVAIMEDQLPRTGSFCAGCPEVPYDLLRYYTFQLTPERRSVQLSQLKYKKLARVETRSYLVNQELLLEAPDALIQTSFLQRLANDMPIPESEALELTILSSQKNDHYLVQDQETTRVIPGQESFVATSQIEVSVLRKKLETLERKEGEEIPQKRGQVTLISEISKGKVEMQAETYATQNVGRLRTTVSCEREN